MNHMHDVSEILKQYKANMDNQKDLDEKLLTRMEKKDWIECLLNRAAQMQQMFTENGQLIQKLEVLLKEPLTEDTAQLLYDEVHQMYWDGYDDCQILLPMIHKLIAYYEQTNMADKITFLYGAAYYEENEIQNRRDGSGRMSTEYNLKVLAFKPDYFELPYDARRRFWGAYYNVIVVAMGNRLIDVDTSYCYFKQAREFWNNPYVQKLDGKDEAITSIVERICNEWLAAEEYIEDTGEETKAAFCELACNTYEKELKENDSICDVNSEVYAAYLHAQVLLGKRDWGSIVDEYFGYYYDKIQSYHGSVDMTDEDYYFIMNTPLTIERWLKYDIPDEKRKTIMNVLKKLTKETWYQKLTKLSSPFVNEVMSHWCFTMMKYMDTQDEKELWLFELLIRRQLTTYLHSVMVMHLAEALCSEVKESRPELFDSLAEIKEEEILDYVHCCALLHDVGKTKITDIVNTQGRKLWDNEFCGIKQHPVYGAEMVNTDRDLAKYHDVVIGHHKFYDGKGGYPEDFDNTLSPYRIFIDLITICDCIDAATDNLGRNYKTAKTLDMVLEELIEGKGHRYNPDLVEVIEKSEGLRKKMQYIVSEGRMDIMYRAYFENV